MLIWIREENFYTSRIGSVKNTAHYRITRQVQGSSQVQRERIVQINESSIAQRLQQVK